MNRQSFNKWFLLLITFVVLVLGAIYFSVTPRNTETLKTLNNQVESAQEPAVSETIVVDKAGKVEPVKMLDNELTAIMDELAPHQYHQDAFLEASTVAGMYSTCLSEFGEENQLQLRMAENNQMAAVKGHIKFCAEGQSRYPKLFTIADDYMLLKQIPASTALGELWQQDFINYDPLNPKHYQFTETKKLTAVINSQNAMLLTEMSWLSFNLFHYGEVLPVSKWLSSHDSEYNLMVMRHALSKMACSYQPNSVCNSFGALSSMYCYEDQALCGLDFDTIYNSSVMPGMQKDVELLISNLGTLGE